MQQNPYFQVYQHDLPSRLLEDVKVRTLFTMQVPQKKEYFGLQTDKPSAEEQETLKTNYDKMRRKITSYGKSCKELPQLQVSFLTRARAMEVCFGDPENEEPNIAASILRAIKALHLSTRLLVCQNIILAGGSSMIPGFKLRVEQEMHYLIDNYEEFKELEGIKPYINMAQSTFPPNCMNWVGASIIAGLNTENEMFMTTYEDFKENGNKMPDRFGEAYLFATRDEPYLNPDFEYKN